MGTQLVLSFAKRLFFNLCNALNPKPNSQTIRMLSPYRNISLFSFVFILLLFNSTKKAHTPVFSFVILRPAQRYTVAGKSRSHCSLWVIISTAIFSSLHTLCSRFII